MPTDSLYMIVVFCFGIAVGIVVGCSGDIVGIGTINGLPQAGHLPFFPAALSGAFIDLEQFVQIIDIGITKPSLVSVVFCDSMKVGGSWVQDQTRHESAFE